MLWCPSVAQTCPWGILVVRMPHRFYDWEIRSVELVTLTSLIIVKGCPHYALDAEALWAILLSPLSLPPTPVEVCGSCISTEPAPVSAKLFFSRLALVGLWSGSRPFGCLFMYKVVHLAFLLLPVALFCWVPHTVHKHVPVVCSVCFQCTGGSCGCWMRPPLHTARPTFYLCLRSGSCTCYKELVSSLCWTVSLLSWPGSNILSRCCPTLI